MLYPFELRAHNKSTTTCYRVATPSDDSDTSYFDTNRIHRIVTMRHEIPYQANQNLELDTIPSGPVA